MREAQCSYYDSESKCTDDKYSRCENYNNRNCLSSHELEKDLRQQLQKLNEDVFCQRVIIDFGKAEQERIAGYLMKEAELVPQSLKIQEAYYRQYEAIFKIINYYKEELGKANAKNGVI